jgi:hypothetical protein
MPKGVRIIDRDRGFNALERLVRDAARGRAVTVGVHSGEGGAPSGGGGMTVGDVATVHEFGLGDVPERSFVRNFADEVRDEATKVEAKLVGAEIRRRGSNVHEALEKFGLWLTAKMQKRIRAGISPALDPVTIERKGSSTPLIDTGQLVSSITHKVE